MREIKFRARRLSDNEWCRGDSVVGKDAAFIISGWPLETEKFSMLMGTYNLRVEGQINVCDLRTVGQFTGLKDKNVAEIYEGDITKKDNISPIEIIWNKTGWACRYMAYGELFVDVFLNDMEVIGNIWDTPHLLDQSAR